MIKVQLFGVLHTTIGLSEVELEAKTVEDIFVELSKIVEKNYELDAQTSHENRNGALNPNKSLKFKDAIVYINGEHCKKKKTAISDGVQIWLLSPAAGG